ncbi:hypothetical protein [Chryseobacterium scophthalmum]|uniref:hypothetical protein n=1 Tax=Chryseobacterium scophthalmum TaxID=59733 RepID=UPI001AEC0228|nr:hypothetical protein [Chryseobacterium scophthalmum]
MKDIIKMYRKGNITKDVIILLEKLRFEKDVELVKEVLREIFSGNDFQENISEYKDIDTLEPFTELLELSYNDDLTKNFPNCDFIGKEGFLGISKNLKPVYEINDRIDQLYNSEMAKDNTNLSRHEIRIIVLDEYRFNKDVLFVANKKSVDIILNSQERIWKTELNAHRIENEEADIIEMCNLERMTYEDAFDGFDEYCFEQEYLTWFQNMEELSRI